MLTIEPKVVKCDGNTVARIHPDKGLDIRSCCLTPVSSEQFAEAMAYYLKTGDRFCEPPEPPIEWTEAIPGVLWYTGEWWVNKHTDNEGYYARRDYRIIEWFNNPSDAKAYAEKCIREEAKREKAK